MKLWIAAFFLALPLITGCSDGLDKNAKKNLQKRTTFACNMKFGDRQVCVKAIWENTPKANKPARMTVNILTAQGQNYVVESIPTLSADLWMPSMSHGSTPIQVMRTGPGTFRLLNLNFTMPGLWELHLHVTDQNKAVHDSTLSFKI